MVLKSGCESVVKKQTKTKYEIEKKKKQIQARRLKMQKLLSRKIYPTGKRKKRKHWLYDRLIWRSNHSRFFSTYIFSSDMDLCGITRPCSIAAMKALQRTFGRQIYTLYIQNTELFLIQDNVAIDNLLRISFSAAIWRVPEFLVTIFLEIEIIKIFMVAGKW